MSDLQHIRSMAEMIIQKVDALDSTKTPEPKVSEHKFKVGDSVYFSYGKTNGVGVVHKLIEYGGNHNDYLIHYPVNDVIANQWFSEELLSHAQPKVAERVWHCGAPPHIGWWNASRCDEKNEWRWWDGEQWSLNTHDYDNAFSAAQAAKIAADYQYTIEWTDYYPENARVPRINPGDKK
jgi:hypothetical protein